MGMKKMSVDAEDLAGTLRSMLNTMEILHNRASQLEREVATLKTFHVGVDARISQMASNVGRLENRFQSMLEVNNLWDGS